MWCGNGALLYIAALSLFTSISFQMNEVARSCLCSQPTDSVILGRSSGQAGLSQAALAIFLKDCVVSP